MLTQNFTPLPPEKRLEIIDTLRGLALFGILVVNIPLYFKPVSSIFLGFTSGNPSFELAVDLFRKFFFEGKFILLLSLLFGYNFWLFIQRYPASNSESTKIFKHRLIILMFFGILHVLFLWSGDVLFYFGMLGFLLLYFHNKTDEVLLKWAFGFSMIPGLVNLIFWGIAEVFSLIPEAKRGLDAGLQIATTRMLTSFIEATAVYSNGWLLEIMVIRIREFFGLMIGRLILYYPVVLGMFIFGLWAARKNLLIKFGQDFHYVKKVLILSFIGGILLNSLFVFSSMKHRYGEMNFWAFLESVTMFLGGFLFCVSYISAMLILHENKRFRTIFSYLAQLGRMSLTNYFLQSIVLTTLSLPYGLGWFGKVSMAEGLIIAIILFILQIFLSQFWLRYFRFGPLEWLIRSLMYRKTIPLKR